MTRRSEPNWQCQGTRFRISKVVLLVAKIFRGLEVSNPFFLRRGQGIRKIKWNIKLSRQPLSKRKWSRSHCAKLTTAKTSKKKERVKFFPYTYGVKKITFIDAWIQMLKIIDARTLTFQYNLLSTVFDCNNNFIPFIYVQNIPVLSIT